MGKSLTELNKKAWYRLTKVLYIFSLLVILAIGFTLIITDNYVSDKELSQKIASTNIDKGNAITHSGLRTMEEIKAIGNQYGDYKKEIRMERKIKNTITFLAILLFIFEMGRRLFYYVVLGNFRPKK